MTATSSKIPSHVTFSAVVSEDVAGVVKHQEQQHESTEVRPRLEQSDETRDDVSRVWQDGRTLLDAFRRA